MIEQKMANNSILLTRDPRRVTSSRGQTFGTMQSREKEIMI